MTPLLRPVLIYLCSQALGVTKTRTSIYEVKFPLEATVGNKVFFILAAVFVERMRSRCSL